MTQWRDRMSWLIGLVALVVAVNAASLARTADQLPQLGADIDQTSVSGLSSGAYMAGQLQLAHSRQIVGAGIVAGGPFACAESAWARAFPFWPTAVLQNGQFALYRCTRNGWGTPDAPALIARAKELADDGQIDPLQGLADDKVYLFSGEADETVLRPVVEAAERFYKEAGVPAENLTLVEGRGGHGFLTSDEGGACTLSEPPYLNDCNYDQAETILEWIYGPLEDASPAPTGRFIAFDQSAFAQADALLAAEGVVYVPAACAEEGGCRVHVALHGCEQASATAGDAFVKRSGFAEIADPNRLVILFPQAKANAFNPHGCWDWWGYTGLDYLAKNAPQIAAIWAMVEHLAKQP